MLEGVVLLWFVLVGLSLIFVLWDCFTNTPISWVQKMAWILVIFYTGPVGLFFYLLACRNPGPDMHDAFTKASWKQSLNSEMHCLAGDATGIVVAAIVVSFFHLPNGIDIMIEYATAFLFGLFIFQALMMLSMFDNDYVKAVRKTIFAETVSMNTVMIGMIPAMVILKHYLPAGREPSEPLFWFIMGMGTIVGGITAYPINAWLIRNNLKHGCMTLPKTTGMPMEHMARSPKEHADHEMNGSSEPLHGEHEMPGHGHHHSMGSIPSGKAVWITALTFLALLLVVWLTSVLVTPITVTP
jgi:hypothetical protein